MNPTQTSLSLPTLQQQAAPLQPTTQTLHIKERQVEHFKRVLDILNRFYFYVDGSEMGTGKTYIAAGVALTLQLPVIVVCPKQVKQVWRDVFTTYGVPTYQLPETGGVMTYDALRSRKGYQPKHGLLIRDDTGEGTQFYPTSLFVNLLQAGVLVIFDECQKLKNTSDQHKAVKALVRQFYAVGGKSRVAFLTGTMLDKPEHAVNFLRMVGFITSRNLYSKVRGEVRQEGINDLHQWAARIDSEATSEFIAMHPFEATRKKATDYAFDLFETVIKPGVMSIMPSLKFDKDIKNGYYTLPPEDEREYRAAINDLAGAVQYNARSDTVVMTKENMGSVTLALKRIQHAKKRGMARVAREILNTPQYDAQGNQLCPKVILFANYYEVIDYLLEELSEFNPVELTGRMTSERKRNANVAAFQAPTSECRILIGNPLVGGLGINLHDTTGYFPREEYIMPDYRVMDTHQAAYRVYRDGVVGTAKVRMFYGLSGAKETSVLSAIARKGEVMQRVHREQGAKFPNEYEDEYEAEPPNDDTVITYPTLDDAETSQLIDDAFRRMGNLSLGD